MVTVGVGVGVVVGMVVVVETCLLSTGLQSLEVYAIFIGPLVSVIAPSTVRSSTKQGTTCLRPPRSPRIILPIFFSLEGLATNNGSIVDTRHALSPSEAHNHLKFYLFDNFILRDATNVEGFSRILATVNSRNRAWVGRAVTSKWSSIIHVT